MAERVSRSVRRLDDIQMRVQRALALVEDVINLRGCAEVTRLLTEAGGGRVGRGGAEMGANSMTAVSCNVRRSVNKGTKQFIFFPHRVSSLDPTLVRALSSPPPGGNLSGYGDFAASHLDGDRRSVTQQPLRTN